jgi:predicted esterase YcpF (UPF0227 family)
VIVYLHGFNSSPRSHKAQLMGRYMTQRGLGHEFACPALPPSAREAIRVVDDLLAHAGHRSITYVGSSLGGYYATYLTETRGGKAVLLNPAIDPHVGLRAYLGHQTNLHTGEAYELTQRHLDDWRELYVTRVTPQRYRLIVETGDEVLDYRRAVERYAGAELVVVPGGDHSLQSFPEHLARILAFAGH